MVREAALKLEMALRENKPRADTEPLVKQLESTYQSLQRHLLALERPTEQSVQPVSQDEAAELLHDLCRLLDEGEISVQERVRMQAPILRGILGEQFPAFERLIASFDFEAALALLRQLSP